MVDYHWVSGYILLSLKGGDFKLKCKAALPKPGGKLKDNFCSASLPLELVKDFDFDLDDGVTENYKLFDGVVSKIWI